MILLGGDNVVRGVKVVETERANNSSIQLNKLNFLLVVYNSIYRTLSYN